MPPRQTKKPTGGPAVPKKPAGRPERVPPKSQVTGDVGKVLEVPVTVKEQSKEQRMGGGDLSKNGPRGVESQWDAAKPITLQFGTINPGLMNGMQIPARTCSAPPNLDEQKKDQARHESFRVPAMSLPSVPKVQPQQPRKDISSADRSSAENPKPPVQVKRDVQGSIPSGPVGPPPKPTNVHPPIVAMQATIPFQHQQPQVPLQFGGPNPQMHPQGLAANSLQQIPMPLPVGSAPQVAQQIFIPSHHMLQQQAMMHQGQGLSFVPPGHQLAPQLGSLGVGIVPQFPQQQPNKFSGPRKTTVKITHPDTHEELRLDKRTDSFKDATSSVQRSLPTVAVQSPHVSPAYPPTTQYYAAVQTNSYNASQLLFPAPHVPLSSSQLPASSQAPRYPHPVGQTLQFPHVLNVAGGKPGPQTMRVVDVVNLGGPTVSAPAPNSVQVTVKPPLTSQAEKGRSSVTISMPNKPAKVAADISVSHQRNNESVVEPVQNAFITGTGRPSGVAPMSSTQRTIPEASSLVPSTPAGDSVQFLQGNEGNRREPVRRSDSFKDNQKKSTKKDHKHSQQPHQSDAINFADSAKDSAKNIIDQKIGEGNLQDAPQASSDEPNSGIVGISTRETEKSEASISSGHLINRTVPNKLDAGVVKEKIGAHCVERVADAARDEYAELPRELSQDLADAKAYPVPLNQSSKDANSVALLEVEQNTDTTGFSDKAETYKNVGDLELEISRQGSSRGNGKAREVKDHISDKPVELIDEDSASSSCGAISAKDENFPDKCITAHEVSLSEGKAALFSGTPESTPETVLPHGVQKVDDNDAVSTGGAVHLKSSGPKEKPSLEISKPKITVMKKKKKIKEILSKADAAGASDLYNAYKGPEGKPEAVTTSESIPAGEFHVSVDVSTDGVITCQQDEHNKSELDDWEDAADVSTPRLGAIDHEQPVKAKSIQHDEDGDGVTGQKKYSRDFLLTLSHQAIGLPDGFQIGSDIANALMSIPVAKQYVIDLDPYSNPGMIIDRPGTSRIDRRNVSNMEDDKWIRSPGPFGAGRDPRLDIAHGAAVVNLRPGQGANHGVLRNPRGNNFTGGILSGPQTIAPQGGMGRSNSDADRWQKATGQRGLMPSPQGPMPVMHKAEKKYEVGKISDEEEAKQRQLKAILNKLTPQNFDKLFAQVIDVNIDNPVTLTGVISQIFDKALMEPTFCEMYADLCSHLSEAMPDFVEGTEKITFKRLLLNKCQEEFERGEREQAEANRVEEEGEIKQTEEEREEKRIRARRRMLGNIRLIGELYKKKMLTERIMHECIKKLLGQGENHDEEDIEALCKLMSTIGEIIDNHRAKEHMDAYFEQMKMLSTNQKLSPRVRFLLRDTIDLRKNKWRQRIKVEGPKKIDEVHRDAAQERQGQGSRSARGPVIGSIPRRGPTVEYGLRGPGPLTSPVIQQGAGIRGMAPQIRSYTQDIRFDDRHQFESRSLLVPQRSAGDDSITFGPQGGLARGMSIGGQPLMPNVPTAETLSAGDYRRMPSGQNGYNPILNSSSFNARESRMPERTFDRSASIPPSGRAHAASNNSCISSSQVKMSEDRLREKSMLAIREFYSSKDEKELVQCVKELNAPSYYPTMISQWVTDSFERKDKERDLLAKLIVNLSNSQDSVFRPGQLIQGYEHVLSFLEDAVTDAPRAVEFLGRIFATTIVENVISFKEVGRLIREGGEEPGQLLESGLAAEVLGSILESIRLDKGDSVLNSIRVSSDLRLEDFRPPDPIKSKKLEAFL